MVKQYIKVKDSKHFTWDVMNNSVTVHVNARIDIKVSSGSVVRILYMGTTMQVFDGEKFIDVNKTISKHLSKNMVYDCQSLNYDYYKIQFPPMGR